MKDCYTCQLMLNVHAEETAKGHHELFPELHGPGINPSWYCPECGQADGVHLLSCNTRLEPEYSFEGGKFTDLICPHCIGTGRVQPTLNQQGNE